MDGLQNHVEATTSLEAQGVLSFEIIVDACLPAVVERDLANALRSHLEDERHCESQRPSPATVHESPR